MWTNWSGGYQGRPSSTVRPLDEAGVRSAVRRAAERGQRVRPVGSGYSFSPLALTDDVALDLSALTGVVRVLGDRVRVRAGTTLGELNSVLAGRDLALAALADVDAPTVAGAIATGTHGSMSGTGSLSAQVTGLRMVEGTGNVVEVSSAELDAARTGLGALGVITEVEFAVLPAFVLRASQARLPLDEALAPDYLDAHRWAEFSVFPYAQDALARWADEVTEQPQPPSAMRSFERRVVRSAAVGGGVALGRTVPRLVPTINRAATRFNGSGSVTDLAHRVLVARPIVRWDESEWALPREALADGVHELLDAISDRGLDVGFPLEVRVGPAESGWLHPAHDRPTGWVAVHTATGTDPEPLVKLTADVLGAHGGRPHWGKRHPWTAAKVAEAYPKLTDFQQVRNRLDPNRLFTNPYLHKLLG
ncbi:D-arabinono-1,4-lactone oxidase [Pseudonocardia spinosispora]|uniref:D-arabinono-1,4-lactone oxidase n=1 Tax=Pseudonocardia spinosispora TaxID=103441 RepID=UPI0003F8EF87|nr:D-arabinono-1,4-lactone oxidase [Pseudonocardia spinosispora]